MAMSEYFEEINRLSREILIKTKDVVQELGCELIYADTDSIFIKSFDGVPPTNQYEKIVSLLRRETGLPTSVQHNFKFLVLLPLEANEKIEALKQYYGITHEGHLIVRGVEIRRHDTPKFIKEFQTELLSALFDCENTEEITNKGYESALMLVTKAIDKIMIGGEDITQDDLVISKLLGQDITKYRHLFPHVSAAIQLSNGEDKLPSKGDTIKYIFTDSQHKSPLCRVTSIDSANGISGKLDYDKEKYKEMIVDAAETVLGYFGFDRSIYGKKKKSWTKRNASPIGIYFHLSKYGEDEVKPIKGLGILFAISFTVVFIFSSGIYEPLRTGVLDWNGIDIIEGITNGFERSMSNPIGLVN